VNIKATEYGREHVMSKDFRGLLSRIAAHEREVGWEPEDRHYMLGLLVTMWLSKPSRIGKSLLDGEAIVYLDAFMAENQDLIDAAIAGLWE